LRCRALSMCHDPLSNIDGFMACLAFAPTPGLDKSRDLGVLWSSSQSLHARISLNCAKATSYTCVSTFGQRFLYMSRYCPSLLSLGVIQKICDLFTFCDLRSTQSLLNPGSLQKKPTIFLHTSATLFGYFTFDTHLRTRLERRRRWEMKGNIS